MLAGIYEKMMKKKTVEHILKDAATTDMTAEEARDYGLVEVRLEGDADRPE